MSKATILLVEDEVLISQDITEILTGLGYSVVGVADNGLDAINFAKTKKPNLIIMDIALKGSMDGIKTTEEIHKDNNIPVIYLTSHIDENRIQRAKFTEPYGYIIKPFDEKTLHSTIEMALFKHKSDSEKQSIKENVTVLSRNLPLTDNEKNVLYGIIKFPDMNDIELGRVLKIKRSTVTSIRNRLMNEGYYSTYRIPDFKVLGCELMTLLHGNINGHSKYKMIEEMLDAHEHVFTMFSNKKLFGILISKSFSEFKQYYDSFKMNLKKEGICDEVQSSYYPFDGAFLSNFFDYSKYMKKRLDITKDYEYEEHTRHKTKELTKNEKKIIYTLIKYPTMSDTDISTKTGISRSSISQTRRQLTNDGLIKTLNIPSLAKLRSELISQSHLNYEGIMSESQIKSVVEFINGLSSNILLVISKTEICMVNAYNDFTDYEQEKAVLSSFFKENNLQYVADDMVTVQSINFTSFDIAPIVKKVLGLDVSY
jgi:DNA-binding NarL/FixJ family response regulator